MLLVAASVLLLVAASVLLLNLCWQLDKLMGCVTTCQVLYTSVTGHKHGRY